MRNPEVEPPTQTYRDEVVTSLREELRGIRPGLPDDWPPALLFQSELGLDSLDLVELVARIEQNHQMLIPDADLPNFISLDALADYVCARKRN